MELVVPNKKLREALEDFASAKRQYGQDMAKKLHLRRDALLAADSLADFWPPMKKPERVHELIGDLKGLFSIDLKQPQRLLFKPIDEAPSPQPPDIEPASPSPQKGATNVKAPVPPDELTRWKTIRKLEIVRVEDTHG